MNNNFEQTIFPSGFIQETVSAKAKVEFKHVSALDGTRAIAVLLVIFFHAALIVPDLKATLSGGFLGVDIFFVLSGFLITSILLQEFDQTGNINFKHFYARRFLRLMPAYWLHLAILFSFGYLIFTSVEAEHLYSNNNFIYAFFYLTNWQRALYGSEISGLLSHTWSLAIEEQFYLFWAGFLFLMLRRLKRNNVMWLTAAIITAAVLFRAWRWNGQDSVDFLYNAFDSRIDALLVGCLTSMIISWQILPKSFLKSNIFDLLVFLSVFIVAAIIFNLPDSYNSAFLYQGGFTLFAVAVGIIIVRLINGKKTFFHSILETKPVVWIGKTSYGLYLWHSASIAFVHQFNWSPFVKLTAALLFTFSITAISYYLLEKPFLKLKQKFHVNIAEYVKSA